MTKKHVLAGAIIAGMLAAEIVGAPVNLLPFPFPLAKPGTVRIENALERFAKENAMRGRFLMKRIDDLEHYRTDTFDESSYLSNEESLVRLTARLMMGEDGDNRDVDKIADAWTLINRFDKGYGKTIAEIALDNWQYSCFNDKTDSNIFLKIPLQHNEEDFLKNLQLSRDFWSGKYPDPTQGATHYYNPDLVPTPDWVKGMKFCGRIGHHLYYK